MLVEPPPENEDHPERALAEQPVEHARADESIWSARAACWPG